MHNGIITNCASPPPWASHAVSASLTPFPLVRADKELRLVLEKRGYKFETDTDTEVAAVLTKYLYDSQKGKQISFTALIKSVIMELVRPLPLAPLAPSSRH